MINWHIVTAEMYRNGTPIDGHMYFLSDTKEIYRGTVPFTESVVLYTELPIAPAIAINKLYINSTTLEGRIWNGSDWTIVIQPVADVVEDVAGKPVSGKAVAAYVSAEMAKMANSADTISALSWDSAEHLLTITKGNQSTEEIIFDGLGVNLQYVADTGELQLLDASGNAIGNAINLGLEKFVSSGEYDPESQNIILYFDAEKTESVTIPVGSLVDTYTAESSNTVDLNVTNNKFVANVKIHTGDGNLITADENGLYVAPIDLTGKMDKVAGAVEGNIATLDAEGNVIDSGKSFDDLASNVNIFKGTGSAPADVVPAGTTPAQGDIAIVKTQIGTTEPAKYQHTAYVYDETNGWMAMDGNYSAANVFFPEDLKTTNAIGNITLTNGQATVAAAGKNLIDVWNSIFVQPKDPTVTPPSVSLTFSQAKKYEVGSEVAPSYNATLNPGSYEWGPNTGITASSWAITATDGSTTVATASTNSGNFDTITVRDATNYKIKAVATYEAGTVPNNNLGNPGAGQIAAGSKEATSSAITGYRKYFYGTVTNKDMVMAADSEGISNFIRGLTNSTSAAVNSTSIALTVPVGAMRVIFAYPESLRDVTDVLDKNASSAQIKSAFTQVIIPVEGANNFDAINYKVYYQDLAKANDTANTYNIKI